MPVLAVGATAAALAIAGTFLIGNEKIVEGACDRLEPYLRLQMKPLVVSAHGSPGVGKSFMHKLAARALYNRHPHLDLDCPGMDCSSLKVFSGLDYVSADRNLQHAALKAALVEHLNKSPQALIVIDEYDKMDCETQFMFRQLIQGSHNAKLSMNRAIVVLESNAGFHELHQLLVKTKDRLKLNPEKVQRMLKEIVSQKWDATGCHDHASLWKMVSMVDFFLPFLPLEQSDLRRLFDIRLNAIAADLLQAQQAELTWAPDVIAFLCDKVDYDGRYSIEGAKEASVLLTRYVSRALRQWQQQQPPKHQSPISYAVSQTGYNLPEVKLPQFVTGTPKAMFFLHLVVKPQGHGLGLLERRRSA
ncbi:hypothetical protein WJX74_005314 [Apatococcus lobatus]|uniref:ATPase AAA-type core domain-containing protein n=1 Tax=Apatococcus lobatus TaxID=904363 RepID=A0AAW1QIH4_9CHLO